MPKDKKQFKDQTKNLGKKISDFFKNFGEKVSDFFKGFGKKTSEFFKNIGKTTSQTTAKAGTGVKNYVHSLSWQKVKTDLLSFRDMATKYNKKDRKNFFGIILAIVIVFLAIFVPIVVNNQEIEEAKAAAAEAQRIAFEEARQAAIEAEKKAEEERLAAINAALTQQAALDAESKAAKEAAEKAAKEREELIAGIDERLKESVNQIIDDSSAEDFKTQYEIQSNLMNSQDSNTDAYEKFTANLLDLYDQKYQVLLKGINDTVDSVNDHVDSVNTHVDAINEHVDAINDHVDTLNEHVDTINEHVDTINAHVDTIDEHVDTINDHVDTLNAHVDVIGNDVNGIQNRMDEKKAADEAAEQAKYKSHYSRTNRVDFQFAYKALAAQYIGKLPNNFNAGFKLGYLFDEKTLLAAGTVGYTFYDWYEGNIGLEAGLGVGYDFNDKQVDLSASIAGIFRYTVHDGFELVFRPEVLFKSDVGFKNFQICYLPLSFGVSIVF